MIMHCECGTVEQRIPFSGEAKKISLAYRCSVFCNNNTKHTERIQCECDNNFLFTEKAYSVSVLFPHIYRKWQLTSTAEIENRSSQLQEKHKASCVIISAPIARNNSFTKTDLLYVCLAKSQEIQFSSFWWNLFGPVLVIL